jgi:Tfp pilus assembly protein PilX
MTDIQARIARLQRRLVSRIEQTKDEKGFALLTALSFIVLMAGLTVVLLSVVLGQLTPTYLDQKTTKTVYSAQAGVQATLAVFRAIGTSPTYVYGDPSKLPCTITGNTTGSTTGGNTYAVAISYYSADPTNLTGAALTAVGISCSPTAGLTSSPKYAVISSTGGAPAIPGGSPPAHGNRTIVAIYQFQVSNVNIPGGHIYDSSQNYCINAVSNTTVGSLVKFVPKASCVSNTTSMWIYAANYQIQLADSIANPTTAYPNGLCITGPIGVYPIPSASAVASQNVLLEPCQTSISKNGSATAGWNQLWEWTGAYSWYGQDSTILSGSSNECLSTGGTAALNGLPLTVQNGCNGSFIPDSAVGPGAASKATNELVNYSDFGRCADVTNEQIASTNMISYPCKQDPSGQNGFTWNQKWYYSEPGTGSTSVATAIYVWQNDNSATAYCLQSAGTVNSTPVFVACPNPASATTPAALKALLPANEIWTRNSTASPYTYSFIDYTNNNCLTADANAPWPSNTDILMIDLTKCTTASTKTATTPTQTMQQWNAPSSHSNTGIAGYKESNGS